MEEFLSHFSELPQEDVSAQEIDKKKIVLVDVLPTPNTTFAEAIAKDEKKGIVPLTLDTAVDASKMLLAFTGRCASCMLSPDAWTNICTLLHVTATLCR